MSEQPEFTLPEELESSLQTIFPHPKPDKAFVDRLGRQLSAQARPSTENRPRFQAFVSPLTWAGAAVLLVLVLTLLITRLLPPVELGQPIPTQENLGSTAVSTLAPASILQGQLAYIKDGQIWVLGLPSAAPEPLSFTQDGGRPSKPRWSPSGTVLAYQSGTGEVFVANSQGNLFSLGNPVDFAWSPVADRLAYTDGNGKIYLYDLGSNQPALLSDQSFPDPALTPHLAWSPDGDWIAYEVFRQPSTAPNELSIWKVKADGGEPVEVYTDSGADPQFGMSRLAGWTADGKDLIFWGGSPFFSSLAADGLPLALVPADGGELRKTGQIVLPYDDFIHTAPAGVRLAIVTGDGRNSWTNKQLYALESGSGTLLTKPEVAVSSPAWSPDGARIAYAAMPIPAENEANGPLLKQVLMKRKLWVYDLNTGQNEQITDNADYRDEYPLWSADGNRLLFVRIDQQDHASIWTIGTKNKVVMYTVQEGDTLAGIGEQYGIGPEVIKDANQAVLADGILQPGKILKIPTVSETELTQVLSDLKIEDLSPQGGWAGYYGHIDWGQSLDWWQPKPGQAIPSLTQQVTPRPTATPLPATTFTPEPTSTAGATQTYTNPVVGYTLDYPRDWFITVGGAGDLVDLTSFDPDQALTGSAPDPGDTQIEISYQFDIPDLATIRRVIAAGNNQFIDSKEWTSTGGISGLWVRARGEYLLHGKVGRGDIAYLYLSLGARSLEITTTGDLSLFESIISTLRPAGWRVSTPNPPLLESPTPESTLPTDLYPSLEDLTNVLYASDPDLPQYDPQATAYAEFADALIQLSSMGPDGIDAVSYIAHAVSFPRRDSYLAAQALISFGPDIAATTLPVLIEYLHSPRTEPR